MPWSSWSKRTKMHVIVWLHESKQSIQRLALPHQSPKLARHEQFDLHLAVHRCWGLSAPFQWLFLLQDDPTTYHGRIKNWRLGGASGKMGLGDIKASKAVHLGTIPFLGTLNQMVIPNILSWEICDIFPQYCSNAFYFCLENFWMCKNSAAQKRCEISLVTFVWLFFTLSFQMCRQIECP